MKKLTKEELNAMKMTEVKMDGEILASGPGITATRDYGIGYNQAIDDINRKQGDGQTIKEILVSAGVYTLPIEMQLLRNLESRIKEAERLQSEKAIDELNEMMWGWGDKFTLDERFDVLRDIERLIGKFREDK